MSWAADVLARRGAERDALIERARAFVDELGEHLDIRAASIGGSVARGDFNVWSDVDVLLVVDDLPERLPDRLALLWEGRPPRVQPVGLTPSELEARYAAGDPLVVEVVERGVPLRGEALLRGVADDG